MPKSNLLWPSKKRLQIQEFAGNGNSVERGITRLLFCICASREFRKHLDNKESCSLTVRKDWQSGSEENKESKKGVVLVSRVEPAVVAYRECGTLEATIKAIHTRFAICTSLPKFFFIPQQLSLWCGSKSSETTTLEDVQCFHYVGTKFCDGTQFAQRASQRANQITNFYMCFKNYHSL